MIREFTTAYRCEVSMDPRSSQVYSPPPPYSLICKVLPSPVVFDFLTPQSSPFSSRFVYTRSQGSPNRDFFRRSKPLMSTRSNKRLRHRRLSWVSDFT